MSPLLFVLVSRVLIRVWQRAEIVDYIRGFQVQRGCLYISYLQYADDTILFLVEEER